MISNQELSYWLALWRVPGVGPSMFRRVLRQYSQLESFFSLPSEAICSLGFKEEQAEYLRRFYHGANIELQEGVNLDLQWLEEDGASLITVNDPLYPALLSEIPGAPPFLFVKGDPGILNWPQIAMVGSRSATRQGFQNALDFAKFFAQQGFAVTSGLAMGIDAAAHKGALDGQGPTIGVMAHGLDKIFPKRNSDLASQMLANGAWVSEFPIGVVPKPSHFPRRNRIISGLSLGVLVVEAAVKSGSLITARQAIQQNREVFAIPGSIHNPQAKGCHEMIRQGAKLVENAADVTDELVPLLGYQQSQLNLTLSDGAMPLPSGNELPSYDKKSSEYQVLTVLDQDPMPVDEIVIRTGMNVADINAALVMLEIDGAISNHQGGYTLATAV